MKKTFLFMTSAAIILIAASGIFYAFKIFKAKHMASAKMEKQYGPADFFYLQRSFPDKSFDEKAFLKVMDQESDALFRNKKTNLSAWTLEGPGNIGGRINSVVVHPQNQNIIYSGNVTGGIFKTTDGGNTWFPIFDQHPYLSIGVIVLDPQNPEVVFAGTGDPNIGGYPFIGNGLYRSPNGGATWEHLGLEQVGIISRIAIDPQNSQTIYVATMGIPFERNQNRGLYKTTNGGQDWQQILFISEDAGVIDLAINPQNPQVLYAAGWNRIRNNSESLIVGQAAKIYKSVNGGTDWTILTSILPQEDLSRVGIHMDGANPNHLLAIYVGTDYNTYGIYETTNAGDTWTEVSRNGLPGDELASFGWYFGQIRINPYNPQQFFVLGVDLWRTDDGGANWVMAGPEWWTYEFHADKHDLIFLDANTILCSTDGGLYRSDDGGDSWTDIENIPNTQFYRIAIDPVHPGMYAGGAQDNGTSYGNQQDVNNWTKFYGGDGFQPIFHPTNANIIYCETQNGNLVFTTSGSAGFFEDFTSGIDYTDRRSWDMPVIMSPQNPATLFTGTYRVYKITNAPNSSWEAISEDLTDGTNSKFHVITTIDQSPADADVLYAGTTDGKVQRSLDGGTGWNEISEGLPFRYVTSVHASPSDAATVFVTHSGYKDNEFIPHIHKSTDYGSNWTDISGNLPQMAINHLVILPERHDSVLFVATDGGVYHTLDGGTTWQRTGEGIPVVPVYDLAYDAASRKLVAGTHARSMFSIPVDSLLTTPDAITEHTSNHEIQMYYKTNSNEMVVTFHEVPSSLQIMITDISGKVIQRNTVKNNSSTLNYSISGIAQGAYICTVQTGNLKISKKFVKM